VCTVIRIDDDDDKVSLSQCLIKHNTMKMHGGVDIQNILENESISRIEQIQILLKKCCVLLRIPDKGKSSEKNSNAN
jgi:hypothetical protein